MARYKVSVSYIGKNYVGWQRQKNGVSIQEVIEHSLSKVVKQPINIVATGRTDSGVNAKGQIFHFDSELTMTNDKWKMAINNFLPDDIFVNNVELVDDIFHSRYCALYKIYEYNINLGEYDVFTKDSAYQCYYKLDLEKMEEASKIFIGYHDFTSFCSNPVDKFKKKKREIFNIDFIFNKDVLKIVFKGKGFLRYMVRMIVATLIEVGRGKLSIVDVEKMLEARSKDVVRRNAKPNGLTLVYIKHFDLVYMDESVIIRSLHEEDKRLLKHFENYDYLVDQIKDNVYAMCYKNSEEIIAVLNDYECISKDNLEENIVLTSKMIDSIKKHKKK